MTPNDPFGAFVDYPFIAVEGATTGPLAGRTFAVKDFFDVAGYPTGCGHPLKRAQAGVAKETASAVQAVLDAGAVFVGKTITDEVAYSLDGENYHYGTPVNPAAPGRIPGGSSSGSAVAVAGGLADFAIGSDTGGSVRIPASYCGIWGMRPTHGAVPLDRAMPFAPSFDTGGWFARDPETFAVVGDCLLPQDTAPSPERLLVPRDAFDLLPGPVADALAIAVDRIRTSLPSEEVTLAEEGLSSWGQVFRVHQGYEIWQTQGAWIETHQPEFGPGVRERFEWAATITDAAFADAVAARTSIRARVHALCDGGTALLLPTAPDIAPLRGTPAAQSADYRNRALQLLCIAGLAGLPQVTFPAATFDGAPLGLSLIGAAGSDRALIRAASAGFSLL